MKYSPQSTPQTLSEQVEAYELFLSEETSFLIIPKRKDGSEKEEAQHEMHRKRLKVVSAVNAMLSRCEEELRRQEKATPFMDSTKNTLRKDVSIIYPGIKVSTPLKDLEEDFKRLEAARDRFVNYGGCDYGERAQFYRNFLSMARATIDLAQKTLKLDTNYLVTGSSKLKLADL